MKKILLLSCVIATSFSCDFKNEIKKAATQAVQDKTSKTAADNQVKEALATKHSNATVDMQIGDQSFNELFQDAEGSIIAESNRLVIDIKSTDETGHKHVRKAIITFPSSDYLQLNPIVGKSQQGNSDKSAYVEMSIRMIDNTVMSGYTIQDVTVKVSSINKEKVMLQFEGQGYATQDASDKSKWKPAKGTITIDKPIMQNYTNTESWMY